MNNTCKNKPRRQQYFTIQQTQTYACVCINIYAFMNKIHAREPGPHPGKDALWVACATNQPTAPRRLLLRHARRRRGLVNQATSPGRGKARPRRESMQTTVPVRRRKMAANRTRAHNT